MKPTVTEGVSHWPQHPQTEFLEKPDNEEEANALKAGKRPTLTRKAEIP